MPLFPDLASRNLLYMEFFFHVTGGLKDVDAFWRRRGLREDAPRLVYWTFSRKKIAHTVVLEWRPAHEMCVDVRLSVEASAPQTLVVPTEPEHKRTVPDFRQFFDWVKTQETPGGIIPRFGFVLSTFPEPGHPQRHDVRVKRITLEVGATTPSPVRVDLQERDDRWLLDIQSRKMRFSFGKEPVGDDFFEKSFEVASQLSEALSSQQEER